MYIHIFLDVQSEISKYIFTLTFVLLVLLPHFAITDIDCNNSKWRDWLYWLKALAIMMFCEFQISLLLSLTFFCYFDNNDQWFFNFCRFTRIHIFQSGRNLCFRRVSLLSYNVDCCRTM